MNRNIFYDFIFNQKYEVYLKQNNPVCVNYSGPGSDALCAPVLSVGVWS